jgi:hypothetical protein
MASCEQASVARGLISRGRPRRLYAHPTIGRWQTTPGRHFRESGNPLGFCIAEQQNGFPLSRELRRFFFGDVPQRLRWLDIQCGRLLDIKVVEHG